MAGEENNYGDLLSAVDWIPLKWGCVFLIVAGIYHWGISCRTICIYVFWAILAVIAYADKGTRKIRNWLVAALGIVSVLSIPVFPEISLTQRGIGMLCVSLPMFMITMIVPGGFGGGDIKLMAVCGLFLGYKNSIAAFVVAIFAAGIYCVWMLAAGKMERKSRFAFGPFLCMGMVLAVIWNPLL